MEKCSVCVDSSFRKQSGKRNGENPLLFCNPHSLCICRFGKISCLIWGESRTDKVTHLAEKMMMNDMIDEAGGYIWVKEIKEQN